MMTMHVPGIGGIFISYRRADATYPAGWLFDRLAGHYGPDRIFKDVDSIHPGDDFTVRIDAALESCAILLAVIGPRWLTVKGPAGGRLYDQNDFVRLEIETALAREIRIIPVLVDGAHMPRAADLPASLEPLTRRQAITLSQDRFSPDADRLLKALDAILATPAAPGPADQPADPAGPAAGDLRAPARHPVAATPHRRPGRKTILALALVIVLAGGALAGWNLTRAPAGGRTDQQHFASLPSTPYVPQSVAFSPDGTILAVATTFKDRVSPGRTYLFDPATGAATILRGPGSGSGVNVVKFSPAGRILATGDGNGTTYLRDLPGHAVTATLPDPGGEGVESLAFSPAGKVLAAGDFDGSTYLWNLATAKMITALRDPGRMPQLDSVAFSLDGSTLATGDNDGKIYIWNLATRKLAATLTDPGHAHDVGGIAFSPDGILAAGDNDGSTYLWNLATRTIIGKLTDPRGQGVDAIAISPDGKVLAAGDNDGSIYLWDLATRKFAADLTDPGRRGVNSIAFTPAGTGLAVADNNARTYLWRLPRSLP